MPDGAIHNLPQNSSLFGIFLLFDAKIHREFIAACFDQATKRPARERGIGIRKARA
jgi:hypothetical protein